MSTGQISITGIIGPPQDGDPGPFVQLIDITTAWEAVKSQNIDTLQLVIDSPGGNVKVGDDIYDFLNGLKDQVTINTISAGMVGSMATKLFMLGEKRVIIEGDTFFIHNPQGSPQGDSNEIAEFLEGIKKIEKGFLDFYVKETGAEESAIKMLMDNQTDLTAEEALSMGFATEIGNKVEVDASMFYSKPEKKQNHNIMHDYTAQFEKFTKNILEKVNAIAKKEPTEAEMKKTKLEALQAKFENVTAFVDYVTDDGRIITVNADSVEDLVGSDAVFMEENGDFTIVTAGDYTLDDGSVLVVGDNGKVMELKAGGAEDTEALQKKIEALEKENKELKESQPDPVAIEKAIQDELKPLKEAAEKENEKAEKLITELEAIRSEFKVPKSKVFAQKVSNEPTLRDKMLEARKEYKTTKSTAELAREAHKI